MADVVWRVYLTEWLIHLTSKARGPAGHIECEEAIRKRWADKLGKSDIRIVPASEMNPSRWEWRVQLRVPNRRGEFITREAADALAGDLGAGAHVVARWSPEEKALLAYGKRRLGS